MTKPRRRCDCEIGFCGSIKNKPVKKNDMFCCKSCPKKVENKIVQEYCTVLDCFQFQPCAIHNRLKQSEEYIRKLLLSFDEKQEQVENLMKNFECNVCGSKKAIRKGFRFGCYFGDPGYFKCQSPKAHLHKPHGTLFEVV